MERFGKHIILGSWNEETIIPISKRTYVIYGITIWKWVHFWLGSNKRLRLHSADYLRQVINWLVRTRLVPDCARFDPQHLNENSSDVMLVKPDTSKTRMFGNSLRCLRRTTTIHYQYHVNTVEVNPYEVRVTGLMPTSRNTKFSGLDMCYECQSSVVYIAHFFPMLWWSGDSKEMDSLWYVVSVCEKYVWDWYLFVPHDSLIGFLKIMQLNGLRCYHTGLRTRANNSHVVVTLYFLQKENAKNSFN